MGSLNTKSQPGAFYGPSRAPRRNLIANLLHDPNFGAFGPILKEIS